MSKETKLILTVKDRTCNIENDKGKIVAQCNTVEEVKDYLNILGLVMPKDTKSLKLFG